LESAMQMSDAAACMDELGDVLFSCVNLARHLNVDPETALRSSNTKVSHRIGWMEKTLKQHQEQWSDKTMAELELLWQKAKQTLKGSATE
jgi:nucleoside triphosphate diphosphatase